MPAPPPPHPLIELGLGAAWLVGAAAAALLVERVLPPAAVGTALLAAVAVDLLASRAGVRWDLSRPAGERPALHEASRRIAKGAAVGLLAGAAVIALSVPLGWLDGHGEGVHPSSGVAIALVRAAAMAVKDELLYRGIPLAAAARAGISPIAARVYASLTGAAAIALVPGVGPAAVALAAASGWLSASLWQRDQGAFAAVGARTAWILLFGSLLHGGLFDVHWHVGNLAIGNTSFGPPAWLAAVVLVGVGFVVTQRKAAK